MVAAAAYIYIYFSLFIYKLLYFLELLRCSTWIRRFSKCSPDGTFRLKVDFFFLSPIQWLICVPNFLFKYLKELCSYVSLWIFCKQLSSVPGSQTFFFWLRFNFAAQYQQFLWAPGLPCQYREKMQVHELPSSPMNCEEESLMEITLSQHRSPPHEGFDSCSQAGRKQKSSSPHTAPALAAVLYIYSIWAPRTLGLQGPGTTLQSWKSVLAVAGWKTTRYLPRLLQPAV